MTDTLTTKQLAERWNLAEETLENWRSSDKGPDYVKLGKGKSAKVLYRLRDVKKYELQNLIKIERG